MKTASREFKQPTATGWEKKKTVYGNSHDLNKQKNTIAMQCCKLEIFQAVRAQ